MNPLCVVPARRNSKRLPLKNLLRLYGKPMVAYSIDAALSSGVFKNVHVSTEDDEIAAIAKQYGAEVHKRTEALAGDTVSATEVCLDVVDRLVEAGEDYDAIVCLQPTSPLRTPEDIQGAWNHFCSYDASYLVSVSPIEPHYFHWAVHQQGDWWGMVFGNKYLKERQDLPEVFRPNGSIKIGRVNDLSVTRNFFGPKLVVYETPEERSVHVATQFDFDLAEFLLRRIDTGLDR